MSLMRIPLSFRRVFHKKKLNFLREKCYYAMPKKYFDSFYNANASLFECFHYYLHSAYEIAFKDLIIDLKKRHNLQESVAIKSILDVIKCLENCNSFIDLHIPVKMNNGTYKVIRGFRAYHGLYNLENPSLGGLRITFDAKRDHVKALAILSTYKNICMGINFGGAHGALQIMKKDFKEDEIKRMMELYAKDVSRKLNFDRIDIFEPDMYCTSNELQWLQSNLQENESKFLNIVGIDDEYNNILGQIPVFVLNYITNNEELMQSLGLMPGLKDKTFICDGLGKIGLNVARYLEDEGAKCLGFKEIDCSLYDHKGISVNELINHKKNNQSFIGYSDKVNDPISENMLRKECDLLILSSSHKQLNCYAADNIQTKMILECSSFAVTPIAHKILLTKNILVIPDILATAGISFANYLQYSKQNNRQVSENLIDSNILNMMNRNSLKKKFGSNNSCEVIDSGSKDALNDNDISTAVEYVLSDVLEGVLETMNTNKLGIDLRTATYIYTIKKLFNYIFHNQNKF